MQVIHGRRLHVDEVRNLTRHFFLPALVLSLAVAGTHAWPQRTNRLPIVAYLAHAAGPDDPIVMIWRQGLRDLGYTDGQNVKLEFRSAQGHPDRLPGLAEELVKRNADVIFAPNVLGAQALQRATSTTPIVVALIDPVASGLVTNLARPGGNVTGLSSMTAELHSKRLQLLKETIPGLERAAVLWNPAATPAPVQSKFVEELKAAARSLSIELKFVRAQSPDEFAPAFSAVKTVDSLLAHARVHPRELTYATSGPASPNHLAMEQLAAIAQVQLLHVPFKGATDALIALLGGHIQVVALSSGWAPHVESGKLRLLATFSPARTKRWPSVPTLKELGYDVVITSPYGIGGPRGMNPQVVEKLHAAFRKALEDPATLDAMARMDQVVDYKRPKDYASFAQQLYSEQRALVRRLGIRTQ